MKDSLTPEQKLRAQQLTNLFENGSFDFAYDYAESLGDGRGITAGRAGFTSGTGDLLEVVEKYTEIKPDNELAKYIPRLKEIAKDESDSEEGLEDLAEAWASCAEDEDFQRVQDEVVEDMYYQPSVKISNKIGLESALARAAVYDTIIQHGEGDDPDSLGAIVTRAEKSAGGTPASGVDEDDWLQAFIAERRKVLAHAHDPDTREVWAESVGRCDVFTQLHEDGHQDLEGDISIASGGFEDELKA